MRPALTAVVDGHSIRLLADLSDKPWTAEDGELWQATFPFSLERSQLQEAELTVAPDVTTTLPSPQPRAGAAKKKSSSGRVDAAPQARRRRAGGRSHISADEPAELDRVRPKSQTLDFGGAGQADALTRELAELRRAYGGLSRQLDHLEAEKKRTAQRLDEIGRKLRQVTHEREEANTARDRIAAELKAVGRKRDEAMAERDAARRERDQMTRELEAAQRAHHEVLQESNAARAARDRAISVRWVRWR
jgi:hypothetical protein